MNHRATHPAPWRSFVAGGVALVAAGCAARQRPATVGVPDSPRAWCVNAIAADYCARNADDDHEICRKYQGELYDECRFRLDGRSLGGARGE